MTVRLVPVDRNNWREVIDLHVEPEQDHFVSWNVYSLAEASFYPSLKPRAVYDDDTLVGFVMYGYDEVFVNGYNILRVMIDQRYQRRGYGRAAMRLILDDLKQIPDCQAVYIGFNPMNHVARTLYASFGFVDDGRIIDDETIYRLDLKP